MQNRNFVIVEVGGRESKSGSSEHAEERDVRAFVRSHHLQASFPDTGMEDQE